MTDANEEKDLAQIEEVEATSEEETPSVDLSALAPKPAAPEPQSKKPKGRRVLISANWKMHHDHVEALHFIRDFGLRMKASDTQAVDVSVHPPFSDLRTVQSLVEKDNMPIYLGAQHVSDKDGGAYTGEVSPGMLSRLGVRYVIVGHSERRQYFHMDDAIVAATIAAVLRHEMLPILCVGESAEEREGGHTEVRLADQLSAALSNVKPEAIATMVIAYEPIWAIGTGVSASAVDAEDACGFIRSRIEALAGAEAAKSVRVQYGGSANPQNAADLLAEPDIDGLLVGGASLEAQSFLEIVRAHGSLAQKKG